jgi:hypothetical protein
MKHLLVLIFLIGSISAAFAITPEEIVRLIQLKTSDDVLAQLIYTNPLNEPLTPAQVIYLKQNGVSERILSALLNGSKLRSDTLPPQDSESYWVNESARYYYTTTKDGDKKLVVTNLDEKGNRMGPPPPPPRKQSKEPEIRSEQPTYQIPPEIHVTMEPQQWNFRQPSVTSPYSNVSNEYPSFGYGAGYYNPYVVPTFIPDYPGSSFGFHLFPQFTVVQPGFHHGFQFGRQPFPHCSTQSSQMRHSATR